MAADLSSQIRQALYYYIPGLEDDAIDKIHKIYLDAGYRQLKAPKDPDDEWRAKAGETNDKLGKKYAAMEGIKATS